MTIDTSSINPLLPQDSDLQTQDVRDNFDAIKTALDSASTQIDAIPGVYLAKGSNLSDLVNTDTALTNIGFSAYAKTLIDDSTAFQATGTLKSGYIVATKAEAAALSLTSADAGRKIFITSDDGGEFTIEYNATPGTYADDGGSYCGTQFIPSGGDGTIGIVRDYDGFIHAEWFGVSASNTSTINTTSLQAAINKKGTILLQAGTFSVKDLTGDSNTIIKGAGKNKTILRADTGTTTLFGFVGTDPAYKTNVGIEDLSLDGNSIATYGLKCDRVQRNPVFNNIEIYGCTTGVWFRRVFNAHLHGWIHGNTTGILLDSGANASTFYNCLIHSNTSYGVDTADSLDLATGGGGYGGPYYGVVNNVFFGCDVESNGTGIRLQFNTAYNIIDDCYFENNTTYSVSIFGSTSANADGNRVLNSSFAGSGDRINLGGYCVFTQIIGNFANGLGSGNYLINFASNTDKTIVRRNRNYGSGAGILNLSGTVGTNLDYDEFNGTDRTIHMNGGRVIFDGGYSPRFKDGLFVNTGNSKIISGAGTPEGSESESPGTVYLNNTIASGEYAFYIKRTGTGNTGWEGLGTVLP